MKNKKLLIIFVVLLAIYAGVTLFGDKNESSFNDKIADFDTKSIDAIQIHPKDATKKDFSLQKDGDAWTIKTTNESYQADNSSVENALNSLNKIKIKNIITKNPDKFAKYELEDGKCKEVKVFSNKKKLLDLLLSKFKFNQQARTASSYIRLAGKDEVYSTDGFASMSISDNISAYRIKDLAKFDINDVNSIKYTDGDNINKELTKQGKDWTKGNVIVDSTKIAGYLSSMSSIKGSKFVEIDSGWQKPSSFDKLEFNLDDKTIIINAYPDTMISSGFIINSSINDKAYFDSDSTGLYKRIFGKFEEL